MSSNINKQVEDVVCEKCGKLMPGRSAWCPLCGDGRPQVVNQELRQGAYPVSLIWIFTALVLVPLAACGGCAASPGRPAAVCAQSVPSVCASARSRTAWRGGPVWVHTDRLMRGHHMYTPGDVGGGVCAFVFSLSIYIYGRNFFFQRRFPQNGPTFF